MQNPPTRNCQFLDETVYLRLVLAGGWGGNDETTDYPDTRASNFSPQTLLKMFEYRFYTMYYFQKIIDILCSRGEMTSGIEAGKL